MAVSTTNAISGPYLTNGVTVSFPFTFTAPSAAEVDVLLVDAAGEEATGSGYAVALGQESGGAVVFSTPPAPGFSLYVLLDPSFRQEIAFENGSAWRAEPVNEGYDRAAARDQVLRRDIARGLMSPIGEAGVVLPRAQARRGKFLGFSEVDGAVLPVDGTSDNDLLRSEIGSPDDNKGASLVKYRLPAIGAVARSLLDWVAERPYSVTDFRNPSDNDDTGAFNRAAAHVTLEGGYLELQAAEYTITGPVVSDGSGQTTPIAPRMSMRGAGARATIINIAPGDFDAFTFIGSNGVAADAQTVIEGVNLNKEGHLGRNLTLKQYSHLAMRDVKSNGGDLGIDCVDFQESHFENVVCAFGLRGMRLRAGSFTAPNAITLYNCKMGNNLQWGLEAWNAVALNIDGGSYESNKCSDLSLPSFGIRFAWDEDYQIEGTVGLNVYGAYIEQNGHLGTGAIPTGDIWVQNNKGPMAMTVIGTTFQRLNNYCQNNIRIETAGSAIHTLTLGGNGHQAFPYDAGYTPDVSRPYVYLSQPDKVYVDEGANRYVSDIERPDFSGYNNLIHGAMAQAYALFDGTGATGAKVALQRMNIGQIVKTGTGIYEVWFARLPKNAFYIPFVDLPYGYQHAVVDRGAAHFTVEVRNIAGDLSDVGTIGVVVFGPGY